MEIRRIWDVGEPCADTEALALINEISAALGISSLCAKLLCARGYNTLESANDFIQKNGLSIYDPFRLADMRSAAERIIEAVKSNEKVAIYGDYDVDGVSAVATLYLYLEELNPDMELGYYIPDRFAEGAAMAQPAYSMSFRAIG